LTATTEIRRSVAPNVEPGLNPIQPNSRMNVPVTTKARLWAGNARGCPSRPYLPMRGPSTTASAIAQKPPTACTTVEPAKATYPCPSPIVDPSCDIHPPPQTQHPKIGYSSAPTNSSASRNPPNVIRSQIDPTMM